MKLEISNTVKLVLSDLDRLDPVTVFLEDLGQRPCPIEGDQDYWTGQGKLTVSCWGKSWSTYWGGMGQRTLAQFVVDANTDYVLNCLDRGISSKKFTGQALVKLAMKCICQRRRQQTGRHDWELGELSKEEAMHLWNEISDLSSIESTNECWHHSKLLSELFGDEWHYPVGDRALEENHEYTYLERIVLATQQGIALYLEEQREAKRCATPTDPSGTPEGKLAAAVNPQGSGL
jgi:hypothetical protein